VRSDPTTAGLVPELRKQVAKARQTIQAQGAEHIVSLRIAVIP